MHRVRHGAGIGFAFAEHEHGWPAAGDPSPQGPCFPAFELQFMKGGNEDGTDGLYDHIFERPADERIVFLVKSGYEGAYITPLANGVAK